MKRVVILISGRGSNMERLIRAERQGELAQAQIVAVFANRPEAQGLVHAAAAGIPALALAHGKYPDRESFDAALIAAIDRHQPDLVLLAGFMRILSDGFTRHYAGRLMNIHPSLLPVFPGLHTHRRALEAGVRLHGCTVHFVTPELDCGPIVLQAAVPVLDGDDEDTLAARVLAQEHRIYPLAVRWFVEDRLRIDGQRVEVRGRQQEDALFAPRLA
ncbi:MAG: phosphoribosylglycinamide formyltransferase [Zoogloeaceae bacterium]|jgi:phosphoribosylglycinamide formyltransferase-1|nr:phosphoribosylglycinamide formyltransferase [Zoogloeaceae bacterium]